MGRGVGAMKARTASMASATLPAGPAQGKPSAGRAAAGFEPATWGVMRASAGPMPASRRTVAMRRPGWTASRAAPSRGPRRSAAASRSSRRRRAPRRRARRRRRPLALDDLHDEVAEAQEGLADRRLGRLPDPPHPLPHLGERGRRALEVVREDHDVIDVGSRRSGAGDAPRRPPAPTPSAARRARVGRRRPEGSSRGSRRPRPSA